MTNKNFLVTGASSGLGFEVLKNALKDGHQVIGTFREESQKELFSQFDPQQLTLVKADLSDPAQVSNLINQMMDVSLDYIVLNAGSAQVGTFHKLPEETIDRIMQTNLLSNMHIIHALLPKFRDCTHDNFTHIVFVSSLAAHIAGTDYTSYGVSKAGLSHFYHCLKKEYPMFRFLCLEIGAVDTPIHEKSGNETNNKRRFKSKEEMGWKIYHAILTKSGLHTLSWDWSLMRKIVLSCK